MILPCSKITTKYLKNIFNEDLNKLKIIIPPKRIHFIRYENGIEKKTNKCNFDCFYYCYKIDTLENQITWL